MKGLLNHSGFDFEKLCFWSYIFGAIFLGSFFFFNIYIHVGGVTVVEVAYQENHLKK